MFIIQTIFIFSICNIKEENDINKYLKILIDMEDFAKLFPKNEISIKDIINILLFKTLI